MMKEQVLHAWRFFLALLVIAIAVMLFLNPCNIASSPSNIVNAVACFLGR
jgi:4-hydroxybenzoate polyprenyltransferase